MRRVSLLAVPALLLVLGACGDDSSDGAAKVGVEAGDTSCNATQTELTDGSVTFDVKNVGGDVTEVYVYGANAEGEYNQIVGEVENIAPQTSRDFPVTLSAGEYELACKPGQTGDGIRTKLTVTGTAAAAGDESVAPSEPPYDREVEIEARDYSFSGLKGFEAEAGERIEFKLENNGSHQHEFEVFGPDGDAIGEVTPVDPGETGEAVIELAEPGTYRYECGLEDHAQRGMKGTFTVS